MPEYDGSVQIAQCGREILIASSELTADIIARSDGQGSDRALGLGMDSIQRRTALIAQLDGTASRHRGRPSGPFCEVTLRRFHQLFGG